MYLYEKKNGDKVTRNSYSGGQDFLNCKRYYKLKRKDGYREKADMARMRFGSCVEDALRFYYENGRAGMADAFLRKWEIFKEVPLVYGAREGDWDGLRRMGVEFSNYFEALEPSLGISDPRFQVNYLKELWPGSGIEQTAYADILCNLNGERQILDMKVSAEAMPEMVGLDPQLRQYAWISGILSVGFLWFQKVGTHYEKGDEVTVLVDRGRFHKLDSAIWVQDCFLTMPLFEQLKTVTKGKKKDKYAIAQNEFLGNVGVPVKEGDYTKQKISMATARISEGDLAEIGQGIGLMASQIMAAERDNFWPMEPSVRYPRKCPSCPMRGICSQNKTLKDELVYLSNKDWLDEMEDGE